MGSFSIMHWLVVGIFFAIFLVPIANIVHRAGLSRWWCILAIIPLINVIALWIFAFARWPAIDERPSGRAAA